MEGRNHHKGVRIAAAAAAAKFHSPPMIFSLYIINKAGGLVYQRDFAEHLEKLSSNDYLVLAGTFHGYAI
jgi:hypothetical protein